MAKFVVEVIDQLEKQKFDGKVIGQIPSESY